MMPAGCKGTEASPAHQPDGRIPTGDYWLEDDSPFCKFHLDSECGLGIR